MAWLELDGGWGWVGGEENIWCCQAGSQNSKVFTKSQETKKLNTSCYQAVSYLTHSILSIYKQTRRQLNSLESRIRRNLLSSSGVWGETLVPSSLLLLLSESVSSVALRPPASSHHALRQSLAGHFWNVPKTEAAQPKRPKADLRALDGCCPSEGGPHPPPHPACSPPALQVHQLR